MSMNKYMHPHNPYKRQRVDFAELAEQFDFFREACERDSRGRVTVNFKIPQQLSALTRAILLRDFSLRLQLPLDRLIPTVPLRLNYVLWLEDILGRDAGLRGIDIGTGSSCVYPLLGNRRNGWRFVATETDERNLEFARANIDSNGMADVVRLLRAPANSAPLGFPLSQLPGETFDFCMCNPPFFADALQAQGLVNSRSERRPPPMSASSAAGVESFSSGGETLFVTRMMQDSARHRNRCRVFTSMLGRKPSLAPLKRVLLGLGVDNYGTYEFCQGRVMRWGIGWSFDAGVAFPMSEFKKKKLQSRPPLVAALPPKQQPGGDEGEYSLDALLYWCKQVLRQQLRVDYWDQLLKAGQTGRRMRISAKEVTWTRRRYRRRHPDGREGRSDTDYASFGDGRGEAGDPSGRHEGSLSEEQVKSDSGEQVKCDSEARVKCDSEARVKCDSEARVKCDSEARVKCESRTMNAQEGDCKESDETDQEHQKDASAKATKRRATPAADGDLSSPPPPKRARAADAEPQAPVLVANVWLDVNDEGVIELRLQWVDGTSVELLHQLLLYMKNEYSCAAA